MAKEPNVQQAYSVTGEADFVVIIAAPDTTVYDDLMTHLVGEHVNVKRFSTNVALRIDKRSLTLPMDDLET
ncbi:Lrp/AsnC ligand binding domain-containing protein [Asticcacaulis sp. DXS10W]|uniref:Lrp/AsnC ligand binding domain-containing protein n=1 Tax=Asticcacaulis currens TaxID=2984210 RepID=A0ABT5IDE0_9CAUL|nr:Lrp/AsnC ligand binding domain-containing protein [Asticcacaulis currens]MDC7694216.1 Lrp/AsnC ligand binding domain-containing protein [Asticcacaulis currens]